MIKINVVTNNSAWLSFIKYPINYIDRRIGKINARDRTFSKKDIFCTLLLSGNKEIKNLLGFQGSFVSDLFFQSVGLISYLISFTFIFTGINVVRLKEFFLLVENVFFAIIYCIFGTLFFSYFYADAFTLYINGNGGFVGSYLNKEFFQMNKRLYYFVYRCHGTCT